ncbi:MAG: hypothetical protein NVS2B6_09450 [Thermoleophilaceae bacterium]
MCAIACFHLRGPFGVNPARERTQVRTGPSVPKQSSRKPYVLVKRAFGTGGQVPTRSPDHGHGEHQLASVIKLEARFVAIGINDAHWAELAVVATSSRLGFRGGGGG